MKFDWSLKSDMLLIPAMSENESEVKIEKWWMMLVTASQPMLCSFGCRIMDSASE